MKLNSINRSWQAVTNGFNKLISPDDRKVVEIKKEKRGLEKFSSWPNVGRHNLNLLMGELEVRPVDVRMLELFLLNVLPKEISYKNLLASQLQVDANDRQSITDLKRMMAIRNLKDLLHVTVQEMKMIEINHIARNKA